MVEQPSSPMIPLALPSTVSTSTSIWRRTAKRRSRGSTIPKGSDQRHNRRVATHPTNNQRSQSIEDIERSKHPRLLVPTNPSLHAPIMANILLSVFVKDFIWEHCTFLDVEPDFEDGREAVGEVADAECSDETGEVAEIGDGCCDYETQGPVRGDHGDPD